MSTLMMSTECLQGNGSTVETQSLTTEGLKEENRRFNGTGGVSRECRSSGFMPAFRDASTGNVYLSRFADGRIAPIHLLDGLPQELVTSRGPTGRVKAVKESVAAGFVYSGRFLTREQVARAVSQGW